MTTHYQRLGVSPTASGADIRAAYRVRAREHHPDSGTGNVLAMSAVNEAWRVLGDPALRAAYDTSLRRATASTQARPTPPREPSRSQPIDDDPRPYRAGQAPRRWPAAALMLIVAMAVIFVFTAYATRVRLTPTEITSPRILDNGMCIALQASRAVEVPCTQRHYGVVKSVIVPGDRCPLGTEGHYSNDGSNLLCVDPT